MLHLAYSISMFFLSSSVRKPYPIWPYEAIAQAILGSRYDLSVMMVGSTKARTLNREYRGKDYTPDVLAFPISNDTGQIILTPTVALPKAKEFGLTPKQYFGFLFVHACLHLKGYDHGATMEKQERRYCQKFHITHPHNVVQ